MVRRSPPLHERVILLDDRKLAEVERRQLALSQAVLDMYRAPVLAALVLLEEHEPHPPGGWFRLPGPGFHPMYRIRQHIENCWFENPLAVSSLDLLGAVIWHLKTEGILERVKRQDPHDENPYFRLSRTGHQEVASSSEVKRILEAMRKR